ncbi:NAD+ synthase [Alteriqipengyuania flavescens]|uniref:NAD+ synthase n=1 Tax=Alteriqipengyuania flavescens TaxID=3053610 RepID=UPI0025B3968F|nr:NAD+ synthase [Alteriqipengyuania flavescens]WJY19803.1 NAD+ synthase [Alteriqipengyuania flavescens]WJY25745.1 NAD+ synthase [Alteriqipengyuania flavescens]
MATDRLRIALAQIDQRVGDIDANVAAMRAWRGKAAAADLVVFPEMQIIGYPPEDLVLRPALIERAAAALDELARDTADGGPAMLVGTVVREGEMLYNSVALLDGGKVSAIRHKYELPNYGTFDEQRLFDPGPLPEPVLFRGVSLGLPICEDVWHPKVCKHLAEAGAEIFLCVNGSPYEVDKDDLRIEQVACKRADETGVPMAYLNRVGGQDELVFDGASFVVGDDGEVYLQMADWDEALAITEWQRRETGGWRCEPQPLASLAPYPEDVWCAMTVGLRDYVNKNGFSGVLLGLSGGIDSAACAAIAVDALGADRVWCVMLPSRYTSETSLEDAKACAQALGVRYSIIPIQPAIAGFDAMLEEDFADTEVNLTEENIQSRIRGVALMALSNKFGPMLVTTGNKSEMSVGYATIYGDMAGGYNPLKDAYKMTVFEACAWRNTAIPRVAVDGAPGGEVIPQNIIDKPPSAELRPDQKDSDSLPPYPVLDRILHGLIEQDKSVDTLAAEGLDRATVKRIEHLLHLAEYKRRQAPPGVKLTMKNFGRDRRYPITHGFRSG